VTKPRVLPAAEAEAAAAAVWYEARQTGLGVEFVAEIDAALERVQARPASFPVWRVGSPYRRARLKRFPYLIFFRDPRGGGRGRRGCAREEETGILE
jgi:hypothetical protein